MTNYVKKSENLKSIFKTSTHVIVSFGEKHLKEIFKRGTLVHFLKLTSKFLFKQNTPKVFKIKYTYHFPFNLKNI